MAARRSLELKPVPEYDKLSNMALLPEPSAPRTATSSRGGATTGGAAGSGSLGHISSSRYQRNASSRPAGALGRTSLVVKLQQQGRQLIDMGRLQADLLSNTLGNRTDGQDYVNEEDQGFVALLARHVDIPVAAWQRLQTALGGTDGQFWQSGYGVGEPNRSLITANGRNHDREQDEGQDPHAAEEGKTRDSAERKPRRSIFGMPVVQPYNLLAVLWTMCILLLDLTYTAFWVPMNVAFCTADYGRISSGCTSSDLAGGLLYFVNVLLGFQIGVVATHGFRKRTVVDGRLVAWLYVRYGRFWLDFVACVPFLYLVVVLAGQSHIQLNKSWINCLSLLRLLRMVRLVSITKVVFLDSLSGRFQESRLARWLSVTVIYSIFLAYQLAVAINLFACIMVLCAYFEGYENSWMTAVDWVSVPDASPIYQWYCAVYWMIVTATTTGFGDFQPRSVAEQVVSNVAMMGGMIMFGVLVASIANALSRVTEEAHKAYTARRKIMNVMEWAEHRALPPDIRKQVQNFYADKYGHKEEDEADAGIMSALPSRLQAKVACSMCRLLMADLHVFEEMSDHVHDLFAENMRPLRLPAGEDLCQQGDVACAFWILQEGVVEAVRYKEKPETIDASKGPCLLGESLLLGESIEQCRVRPWTLRTVTPCRLWGITIGALYPLMRMYPDVAEKLAEHIKGKIIVAYQGDRNLEDQDHRFCELAAVMVKQMREYADDNEFTEFISKLQRASARDLSLQETLEQILTFCAARRGAAVPGQPGIPSAARRSTLSPNSTQLRGLLGGLDLEQQLQQQQQQQQLAIAGPPQPQPPQPGPGASSAFGTPGAAAALSAALQAATPFAQHEAQLPYQEQYLYQQPGISTEGQSAGLSYGTAAGPAGAVSAGGGIAALLAAGGSGGGSAAACPGCQRCVCPSCGQGMEPGGPAAAQPGAAIAAAAAAASLLQQGVNAKPTAGPALRTWVNRTGTLRRVSIGVRSDQVWAQDRRSVDWRQLGAMSVVPSYE